MNNEIQFILYHLPDEEGSGLTKKDLTHIFDEGELDKYTTVSKMEITTQHGAKEHQGLVPLSQKIAKRLNSIRGTRRFTKPSQTNGYLIF